MVEYASLAAAMAVLASTLTGAFGPKLAVLPSSSATALQAVTVGARAQHVPAAQARAAYRRAPYPKPVLKYLFAVGWIGGKKDPVSCLFARVQPEQTAGDALAAIRKNAKLGRQLARRGVSKPAAAKVVVAGIASACGG